MLFDLCEKRYIDLVIQLCSVRKRIIGYDIKRLTVIAREKTIFIVDRGYETYIIFAHVQEKGMCYLIRVKDAWKHDRKF